MAARNPNGHLHHLRVGAPGRGGPARAPVNVEGLRRAGRGRAGPERRRDVQRVRRARRLREPGGVPQPGGLRGRAHAGCEEHRGRG